MRCMRPGFVPGRFCFSCIFIAETMKHFLLTLVLLTSLKTFGQDRKGIDPETINMAGNPADTIILPKEDTIYWDVDQKAAAGYDVKEFLKTHLQYPEHLRKRGEQGDVSARLIVNKDGRLSNCYVAKGKTPFLREGCRVMLSMPPWKPALVNDKPVRSYVHVTTEFRLKDVKRR